MRYTDMPVKKSVLYLLAACLLLLSACQKEDITGKYEYRTLGVSARDLLTAAPYTTLQIQVDYMPGFAPDDAAISNLTNFISTYANKPGGIIVLQRPILASGKAVLSITDIVKIEQNNRIFFTGLNTITVHILITDGYFTSANTFATSYWNTSTCIFGQAINDNSGSPGRVTKSRLLSTVLQHEMGHLLGLVNQGSPMQSPHKDPDNGAHCSNTHCLMYYGIETNAGSTNSPAPSLDNNCRNDLKANGGK
jgi:predicted Zn-dependent protease